LTAHGEAPNQLMQAMLPLIDRATCNQPNWHNNTVDDSMVCAGYARGELGNCYVSLPAHAQRCQSSTSSQDSRSYPTPILLTLSK